LGGLAKVRLIDVASPHKPVIKAKQDAAASAVGGALCDAERLQIAKTRWHAFH
jgi:hypothetical protein